MTTVKITDLQRKVLEAAAAREGGYVWPLPEALGLRKGSAVLVVRALLAKGLAKERRARAGEPVWREDVDRKAMTALISRTGFDAVGATHISDGPADDTTRPRAPRAGSKLATLITLLERDEGATIAEMATATGWQAHSVRGVLSSTAKKFRFAIVSAKVEVRGRVYRTDRDGAKFDDDKT